MRAAEIESAAGADASAADVGSVDDVLSSDSGAPEAGSPETAALESGPTGSGADGASGLCVGTPIAGSCLAAFFAQAAACFHTGGACVEQTSAAGTNICWADGAKLVLTTGSQSGGFTYSSGGGLCFYGSWSAISNGHRDYTFTLDGVALLVDNLTTGVTT